MLTDEAVRCRVRPICSAIDMKRLPRTESNTGSAAASARTGAVPLSGSGRTSGRVPTSPTSMMRSPSVLTSAEHPGSNTTVEVTPTTSAGPRSTCPARSCALRYTAESSHAAFPPLHSPPKKTRARSATVGAPPASAALALPTVTPSSADELPTARTRTLSTSTGLLAPPGASASADISKPNSRLKASRRAPSYAETRVPISLPSLFLFLLPSSALAGSRTMMALSVPA
mmetsp:Transcript_32977/g.81988  ORF Transcript_32977/g.81988 Transcript_32977/m.81988 type:complete len:229 (-) Transcript_32977:1848-2534(-)